MILKDYIKENPKFKITQKTKVCIDCKKRKSILLYDYRQDTKKLKNQCHKCVVIEKIKWKKNNRDKVLKGSRLRYQKFKKEIKYRMTKEYYEKTNKMEVYQRRINRGRKAYLNDKAYYNLKTAKRRVVIKTQQFPKNALNDEMKKIFEKTHKLNHKYGKGKFAVDHIIPLKNKLVCGLHNVHNLKIIDAVKNKIKANKFIPFLSMEEYGTKKYYNKMFKVS